MSQHELRVHPLVLRTLEVVSAHDVTPRMRRVRLTGAELSGFRRDGLDLSPFAAPGFDDHVKLIFAPDGDLDAVVPRQLADGIEWTDAPQRQCRDYTPRAMDLDAGWIELDFVLHGDGPAAGWARSARTGDRLAMVGPKSSMLLPEETTGILLIGDETALPAIGRFLDERPLPVPAHALVVLEDPAGRQELALGAADSLWYAQQDPADGDALLAAVRSRVESLGGLEILGERPFVWAAGESRALLPLRRWATRENGIPRAQLGITGYWTAGAEEDPVEGARGGGAVPTSPAAWFAVRAALELGLLDALRERSASTADLADAIGTAAPQIAVLLAALQEQGLLTAATPSGHGADSLWQLTAQARDLVDDEHAREDFEGLDAARLLALVELPQALRSGEAAWRLRHGRSFAASVAENPPWREETQEGSGSLVYLQHGLLRALDALPALGSSAARVALVGPGARTVADLIARREGADGAEMAALLLPDEEPDPPDSVDAAVSVLQVHMLEDDEAVAHLTALGDLASEALVITAARPDALGGGAAVRSLLTLAETGAAPRDAAALTALARRAGWGEVRVRELGWGVCAVHLMPRERTRPAADPAADALWSA
ncbi:siderophore-interacting protein [Brachybacterium hainanense]|uniref:Siderophore-interacting protein n=1 Tax=Brachybacterium hainanense TaxID=1541174 RepID=A0ABV6R6I4_9MICO